MTVAALVVAVLALAATAWLTVRTSRDLHATWAALAEIDRIHAEQWTTLGRPEDAARCIRAAEKNERRAVRWLPW